LASQSDPVAINSLSARDGLTISGATLSIAAASQLANLTLSNGTITGSGDVTIAGTFNCPSGTMSGSGKTILASGSTATLTICYLVLSRQLDNHGTVNRTSTAAGEAEMLSGGGRF